MRNENILHGFSKKSPKNCFSGKSKRPPMAIREAFRSDYNTFSLLLMVKPIVQEAVCFCGCAALFGLIGTVQILPPVPENGNDHGTLRDNFIQDSCPGADHNIIDNPQRRVYEHSGNPDFPPVMGIPADGGSDICRHRQNGYPPRPGKYKGEQLHHTNDGAHGLAPGKFPLAPQAKGTEGIDNVTDAAGDCAQ